MDEPAIGTNVRRIRQWRGLTLETAAGLAGLSKGYLSRIENGRVPVDRRSTLEALAGALRVAPSELAERAFPPPAADSVTGEATANVSALESALADLQLGETAATTRPWQAITADLHTLNERFRPATDYEAQSRLLPGLLRDLHTAYVTEPEHRADALRGLMDAYHASAVLLKNLGVRGLPALAAYHARQVAAELDEPAWHGLASWLRASTLGGGGRQRMLDLSIHGADALQAVGDMNAQEMYGALHLNAALASAALRRTDDALAHLDEATAVAQRLPATGNRRGFGNLYFGTDNVGIWRVSIAVELGEPGRAKELAADVRPDEVPSTARRAMFWADLGRGLASQKSTREQAIPALVRAESIAPQRIRSHPLVRETIGELLRRARRDAGGRELRGMAYRMGLLASAR